MQTLELSISLPDKAHPGMELRLSASDSGCDVVIALPQRPRNAPVAVAQAGPGAAAAAADDYVLGGYAGI